jgi:hypothetical protein
VPARDSALRFKDGVAIERRNIAFEVVTKYCGPLEKLVSCASELIPITRMRSRTGRNGRRIETSHDGTTGGHYEPAAEDLPEDFGSKPASEASFGSPGGMPLLALAPVLEDDVEHVKNDGQISN